MRPTRWRRKLNDWNDCVDYRAHERQDRKREASEEVAGQLRDAEPEVELRDPFRGWDDHDGWTTHESDVNAEEVRRG